MTAARQPQQERSRATRERLLDATVEMLAAQGWSATTVAAVAEAAGVSRGAAQHHFPTRESLITAVMEEMFESMTSGASMAITEFPDDHDARVAAVVDKAVAIYTGTEFKAALQVWAAAASDPALREVILPLEAKLARAAHKFTVKALDPSGENAEAHRLAQVTLDLARGLGLADTLSDDSRRRQQVVATWSEQLADALR
ncbi:putative TetR family transcriptional regulator [Gordonia araii NBRC 100433]|uniref:Putative TetR family transcriptional regulator n=1 Tax=Gordonia araii NBRC 100433 TaxID=1073574 RepID=G7H3T1_9ACTN|nr:TetR/AcrR family transcriptional regulator [Gordonia araii]NNG98672.1 TetR/AcrR family transcriptional regulator [Gordonia araii NBRC 100433]GAB10506.1 putative TetR family transcriptional regulator [Gordonia araii NBRC 100433]